MHKVIKTTPFNLLFNYKLRSYDGNPLVDTLQQEDRQMIDEKRKETLEKIKEDQHKQRIRYNKKRARCKDYFEGDLVMVRRDPASTGQSRKLLEKYAGPYIVTERLPNDRYRVCDLPETQRTQKFFEGILAVDSMKKYNPNIEEPETSSDSESEEGEDNTTQKAINKNETEEDENKQARKERFQRMRKMPQKFEDYITEPHEGVLRTDGRSVSYKMK